MACTIKPQTVWVRAGLRVKFEQRATGAVMEIEDAGGCRRVLFGPTGDVVKIVPLTPGVDAGMKGDR
jgi:hypothetical protein